MECVLRYGGPTGNGLMKEVLRGYLGKNNERLLVRKGIV